MNLGRQYVDKCNKILNQYMAKGMGIKDIVEIMSHCQDMYLTLLCSLDISLEAHLYCVYKSRSYMIAAIEKRHEEKQKANHE